MLKNRIRLTAGLLGITAALTLVPANWLPALAANDPLTELRDALAEAGAANGDHSATTILSRVLVMIDRDGNGISKSDIDLVTALRAAQIRAQSVAARLAYDLDGDFAVTRHETEKAISYNRAPRSRMTQADEGTRQRWKEQLDMQIDEAMAGDSDGNGKLEGPELATPDKSRGGGNQRDYHLRIASSLLAADPNADGNVTEAESLTLLAQALAANGTLTPLVQKKIMDRKTQVADGSPPADCPKLHISRGTKLVVIGASYGASLPTVSIAGQDGTTSSATIEVEAGVEPLSGVIAGTTATIWQFKGHTERIATVVVSSMNRSVLDGKMAMGITGLPRDRVSFLENPSCIGRQNGGFASEVFRTKAIVERLAGQSVDAIFTTLRVELVAIPSMKRDQISGRGATFSIRGQDGDLVVDREKKAPLPEPNPSLIGLDLVQDELARFNPGGIDAIDVADVISPTKAERYDLMPGLAGILQLVERGDLAVLERGSYRILKSTRLPPGLEGVHFVQFYLPKGVMLSKDQLDRNCVFSEQEAEYVGGRCVR